MPSTPRSRVKFLQIHSTPTSGSFIATCSRHSKKSKALDSHLVSMGERIMQQSSTEFGWGATTRLRRLCRMKLELEDGSKLNVTFEVFFANKVAAPIEELFQTETDLTSTDAAFHVSTDETNPNFEPGSRMTHIAKHLDAMTVTTASRPRVTRFNKPSDHCLTLNGSMTPSRAPAKMRG